MLKTPKLNLKDEFAMRIDALRLEGLVDLKMKLSVGNETTTSGVVAILNNGLRLRSEGKVCPVNPDYL
ncbi:MAG: hypothetical protein COC24_002145 [Alphaproteobacteria bacterium]|nr:hypothetical protein [Alphaproteobacteria bacterium]